jgi:hypothetical protein
MGFNSQCCTSAWTGTKSGHPFIHGPNENLSPEELEVWYETYCLKLMDLCAELGVKILPMFWGVAFGWELSTGYPWGFWSGPGFDLVEAGKERFVNKTAKLRAHANSLGIYFAHEIHPGTAAIVRMNSTCLLIFAMVINVLASTRTLRTVGKVKIGSQGSLKLDLEFMGVMLKISRSTKVYR